MRKHGDTAPDSTEQSMANACHRLAAPRPHSWSIRFGIDRVFVASFPLARRPARNDGGLIDARDLKGRLATHLWAQAMNGALGLPGHSPAKSRSAQLSLSRDRLGRPLILRPGDPNVHISFSHGADRLWAALIRSHRTLGMDVAHPSEFTGDYPFHQAIHPEEWSTVPEGCRQDPSEAAACLWSIKEAAVKSLGCGFHLLGPRELLVVPCQTSPAGKEFHVRIRPFDGHRASVLQDIAVHATSMPIGNAWLALALCETRAAEALLRNTLSCHGSPP